MKQFKEDAALEVSKIKNKKTSQFSNKNFISSVNNFFKIYQVKTMF